MSGEILIYEWLSSNSICFFVIFLIFSATHISFSQTTDSHFIKPVFENVSSNVSLPNSSITCILQDHIGYLWFGTQNGLARYDGYSTKIFQPKEHDNSSISDRGIVTIYEDKKNTIWVGTLNGLNKLNRADNAFKCYKHIPGDSSSISADSIQCIFEDDSGRFWIGTDKGLNLFNRQKEIFTSYYFKNKDLSSAGSSKSSQYLLGINAIIEDPTSNDLLIGTDKDGLWKFSPKEKVFSKYMIKIDPTSDKKISWIQSFFKSRGGKIWMISDHTLTTLDMHSSEIKLYIDFPIPDHHYVESPCYALGTVAEGREGQIWAGFIKGENGVFCINQKTGRISQYKLDPNAEKNTYDNMIFAVFYDRSEIMWIGTLDRGLWKLNQLKSNFQLFKYNPKNQNSISNINVYDIIYDPKGFLWISTRSALDRYDIKKGTFSHYLKNEKCLTNNRYKAVLDKSGNIWIGSEFGLMKFNTITAAYRFYCNDPHSLNLINKSIFRMLLDKQGNLWIGTMDSGLYRYNIIANKLTLFEHDSKDSSSLSADQIRSLYEDRTGTLWIGTNENGLNKFNSETEKFTHYGFKCVAPMHEDKFGNFWVSEYFTGLNLFDPATGKVIENYNPNSGLAFTEISQILEDNSGNLWLGTRHGLSKFNIKTRTFKNYYINDGIPDDFFLAYHPAKDSNGKMYFITRAGLLTFHPDSIKIDSIPPQIVLSNISLFNRPNPKINYNGFISELKEVVLPYNFNDLRFDFIGFQFNEPSNNKYKYILENFDDDWVNAGTQRNATYTNLSPGEYIFRVTSSNRDEIWNQKGASIKIIITSPWWETTLAYILYVLIIIVTVYLVWKMQLKRIKIKHDFQIRNLEAEKLRELDELKTRFFTNISHEFRTPLTLILGPAKQILNETKNLKIKEEADIIHRSAKKLNKLANQLLDISSIEAGKIKLKVCKQNLIPVIKEIVSSFQAFAERKKISLKFNTIQEGIIIYLDKDKIDKILSNILSNSLKFTPNGGSVKVEIELKSSMLKTDDNTELQKDIVSISVTDTGIGIPVEQLNKIFDRFYQIDNKLSKEYEGTGVGLSLTKELIELHKGEISVESEEGKGTTFRIMLPLGKEHFLPTEIINEAYHEENKIGDENKTIEQFYDSILIQNIKGKKNGNGVVEKKDKPLLLIVEDNRDVRNYIIDILDNYYNIIQASNGEEGLCKSFKETPDLIISDIMMPKIDGIQLCRTLKSDSRTSHIPLILLTAKATLKDKIEGLETGADDYIIKPFEASELKARIKNLVEQRTRIHEHFRKHGLLEIDEKQVSSIDHKFLQKTVGIINEHISDPTFSVERFAESLAISRSLLHKKLIALVGESPGELVKRIRLNKAAKLIENKSGNVTEIAFKVGFNDPSYFAACFKKQFGVSPSQYNKATN